jgi:hypothetical protein
MTFYTALYTVRCARVNAYFINIMYYVFPNSVLAALKQNEQYIRLMSHEDDDKRRRPEPLNLLVRIGWGILN